MQTTIDWKPIGGGTGCIVTGGGTNLTYPGGSLGAVSVNGLIRDLLSPGGAAVDHFMTFSGTPLNFILTSLGPGPSNTVCAADFDPNKPACAAFPGSPFLLTPSGGGTSVILSAKGVVTDGVTASIWLGAFTTQISSQTPAQIQAIILGGGTVSSTYSGDFIVMPPAQPSRNCTLTQGGYKNHFNSLLLNFSGMPPGLGGMMLGNRFYTDAQLNQIIQNNAVKGNGLISLAHQLITAQLNVASGAVPLTAFQAQILFDAIDDANSLIGNLSIPPIGNGYLSPLVTGNATNVLDNYNNGGLGPAHCN